MAGIVVVLVGLAVAGVAFVALREPNGHQSAASAGSTVSGSVSASATPSPTKTASPTTSSAPATPDAQADDVAKAVPLVVLNNTTTSGLAQQAAQRFEAGGWNVTSFGNLRNDIISTCAYYDPVDPAAKTAAEALQNQYSTIKRVEPKFDGLPGGPIVVVLTPDYAAG